MMVMKKMLIICCMVLSWSAKGQIYVNNQNLDSIPDIEYIYISILNFQGVLIDYGFGCKNLTNLSNDGKRVRFRTDIDCLNYFYKNGWELRSHKVDDGYILQRRKIK